MPINKLTLPAFHSDANTSPRVSILFGGDFCPIGHYADRMLRSEPIFDQELTQLFQQSDFTLINCEAPLCDASLTCDIPGGAGLRGDSRIAKFIKELGVDAVGLANNHIRDFGDEGVLQTMRNLDGAGVRHTGAGKNLAEAQRPLSVDVNGIKIGIWALAEKELNVASDMAAGSSWFRPDHDVHTMKALKEQFDLLVVFLHAGHEFISTPSPRIRNACRSLIDAGADAVIAHHPHVAQGVEQYNAALIAYSLGNLVFDSPYVSAYEHTDVGYMIRMSVSRHHISEVDVIPYRMCDRATVNALDASEFAQFSRTFGALCDNITHDRRFNQEWESNVRFRWETEYRRILSTFSTMCCGPECKAYARRAKNLFTCPTHVEMLEHSFTMLEQGQLSCDDRSAAPAKYCSLKSSPS